MKTLIAYASKYGGTKKCAEMIAAHLPGESDIRDLGASTEIDLAPYDCVVVGGSVYMGKIRKAARRFCIKNESALLEKRLGLFLSCIQDVDKNVRQQFEVAFPPALREHASAMEQLGGEVNFAKLGRLDGMIMNMIAGDLRKQTGDGVISTISEERVAAFCKALLESKPPEGKDA